MKILRAVDQFIAQVEKAVMFSMLFLIVGVNLLQIGFRLVQSFLRLAGSDLVLDAPSWPADVNRILVLWITMIGGSLATRSMEHIRVDFFSRLLRGRSRSLVQGAICLAGIAVSALFIKASLDFLKMEYELGETLVAIPLPLWVIQAVIPAGFLTIGFRFLLQLLQGPGGQMPAVENGEPEGSGEPLREEGTLS